MQIDTTKTGFQWLLLSLAATLLVVLAASAYLQTMINTRFFLPDIAEVREFCKLENLSLKDVKLVEYNRQKGEVRLYCLYEDPRAHREIIASRVEDSWIKTRETFLNEPGRWVWPLYL